MVPKQLQRDEYRFILLVSRNKEPIERGWEDKSNYEFNNNKLQTHIKNGGNYGIVGGYGNLIIIDADSREVMNICETLPETFTVRSSEEYKRHYYFIAEKKIKPIRLSREKVGDLGDVRSVGQYVVGPNCIHPLGMKYTVIKDIPIAYLPEIKIREVLKDFIDHSKSSEFKEFKIDTTLRSSPYIKNCKVPDYCAYHKLKGNTSKNWELFPYLVDLLHNRQSLKEVYFKILKKQGHSPGAMKGWVQKAQEGKLMKGSCKKMKNYIKRYHPELEGDICGDCKLHQRIKEKEEMKRVNEFNYRL